MNNSKKYKPQGHFVLPVTPFFDHAFDAESMKKLIEHCEPYVSAFSPCMSTGEGDTLTNSQWKETIECVTDNTEKPVIPGILRDTVEEVLELANVAKKLGCAAIIVPPFGKSKNERVSFVIDIADQSDLPIILYNKEAVHISDFFKILELSKHVNIIGMKESSMDKTLTNKLSLARKNGTLQMSVFQGLEINLMESGSLDGFMVSLSTLEPELCLSMLEKPSREINDEIVAKFKRYNLGGEWRASLKALLFERGIIRSAEQVKQEIVVE